MDDSEHSSDYPGPPKHAFVDAYGDPGLHVEKDATTAAFIVAAVLVEDRALDELRAATDRVRRKYFGPGPIKSNSVGDNDERRLAILSELVPLDFSFAAVALDKTRIMADGALLYPGLDFRTSFFKFVHSKVFDPLYSRHDGLKVVADRIGREEFMESFRAYVLKRQWSLFTNPTFEFARSRENVLIQVADFIAGSLARIYDPKKLSPCAEQIHEMLRPKARWVIDWPKRFRRLPPAVHAKSTHDDRVRRYCLQRVWKYLADHETTDVPGIAARVEALRCLLFWYEAEGDDAWIATAKLTEYLNHRSSDPHSMHHVRSKIIAPLRDCGVIVASSPQGYKIPSCVDDVRAYFEHTQKIVAPMLVRAQAAREALLDLTDNRLDVLEDPAFEALREALDGRQFGVPAEAIKKVG